MKKIIGVCLVAFDFIALIVIFLIVIKSKAYKGDIIEMLIDSWEVIALFIAIMLAGIVLIKTA